MQYETDDELAGRQGMAQAEVTWAWWLNPFDDTDEHHCIDIKHPKFDGTIIRLNNVGIIGDDPHPETGEVHPKAGRLYLDYDIIAVQLETPADAREKWSQEDKEEFHEIVEHIAIQILARDGIDRNNNPKEPVN